MHRNVSITSFFPFPQAKVKGFVDELLLNGRPLGMYRKHNVGQGPCIHFPTPSDLVSTAF